MATKHIGIRIFYPEEFFLIRQKFNILIQKDPRIPEKIRKSNRGLEAYAIKMLIKYYVLKNQ